MSKSETLTDGLLDELKDLYSAENQLIKALPKMAKKAVNPKLKNAFTSHLEETQGQVDRLDRISTLIKQPLSGKTCKAMKGLLEEGKEVLEKESENDALIDALLIGAARRVEHYEIAAYCTARAMAAELGQDAIAKLLGETFDEEMKADSGLSGILKDEVLPEANSSSDEDERAQLVAHDSSKGEKRSEAAKR